MWRLLLLAAGWELAAAAAHSGFRKGGEAAGRRQYQVQHGSCSYTFLLPEADNCRPPAGAYDAVQRDAPPDYDGSVQRLQALESIMENNTQWLLKPAQSGPGALGAGYRTPRNSPGVTTGERTQRESRRAGPQRVSALPERRLLPTDRRLGLGTAGAGQPFVAQKRWWFDACGPSNLNGVYYPQRQNTNKFNGIKWYYWKGSGYSLKEWRPEARVAVGNADSQPVSTAPAAHHDGKPAVPADLGSALGSQRRPGSFQLMALGAPTGTGVPGAEPDSGIEVLCRFDPDASSGRRGPQRRCVSPHPAPREAARVSLCAALGLFLRNARSFPCTRMSQKRVSGRGSGQNSAGS
ncbi:PREDICTED: angiopoietin-2 [Condylura cristata]|uniref:angiopoietin-2 n=1 Tax=Condylura cristata TaxID=143302 RepID=UPI000642FACA|nr:PREDICTED: angiopoietin-2 [Condylura cristata]